MSILNSGTHAFSGSASDRKIKLFSNDNFLDGEILLINSQQVHSEIKTKFGSSYSTYLESNSLSTIHEWIKKRKTDMFEFLNHGRSVVIELDQVVQHSHEEQYTQEQFFSIFDFIPDLGKLRLTPKVGRNSTKVNEFPSLDYFSGEECFFTYHFSIESSEGIDLLKIKNTDYVISKTFKVLNGYVILIPALGEQARKYIKSGHFGKVEYSEEINQLCSQVATLEYQNNSIQLVEPWASEVKFEFQKENLEIRRDLDKRIESLLAEKEHIINKINNDEELVALVSSYGETLEDACVKAISHIGLNIITQPEENRTDIIAEYNDQYFVIEIKGLVKSAREKNAAQLQKWISDFHANKEIIPKGILIINGFRSTPLNDRVEDVFPNQMLEYSTRMEICLLKSSELFSLLLDFNEGKLSADEIVSMILISKGTLDYPQSEKLKNIEKFNPIIIKSSGDSEE